MVIFFVNWRTPHRLVTCPLLIYIFVWFVLVIAYVASKYLFVRLDEKWLSRMYCLGIVDFDHLICENWLARVIPELHGAMISVLNCSMLHHVYKLLLRHVIMALVCLNVHVHASLERFAHHMFNYCRFLLNKYLRITCKHLGYICL